MKINFRKRQFKITLILLFLLNIFLYGFFKKNLSFEKVNKADRIFCMILTHIKNLKEKVC